MTALARAQALLDLLSRAAEQADARMQRHEHRLARLHAMLEKERAEAIDAYGDLDRLLQLQAEGVLRVLELRRQAAIELAEQERLADLDA